MKPLQRSRRSLFGDLIGDAASYCSILVSQSDISGLVSNDDTVSKYLDKVQDSRSSERHHSHQAGKRNRELQKRSNSSASRRHRISYTN
jgi:hypothetical protein